MSTNASTIRNSFGSSLCAFSDDLGGVGELILIQFVGSSRYGVASALVKRMAAAQPFQTEPDTLRGPVDFDGFPHVIRARRIVSAGGRQQW